MGARLDRTRDIDLALGNNLRKLRLQRGLSQEALGEKISVTFQQVQKYEKGTNRISASALIVLQRALGCEILDFFRDVGTVDPVPLTEISDTASKVTKKVNAMPEWKQAFVLGMLREVDKVDRDKPGD